MQPFANLVGRQRSRQTFPVSKLSANHEQMTARCVRAFTVVLAVLLQASLFAEQVPSEQTGILREAAKKIEDVEPDWRFSSGICNFRGPLTNEQVGVECGVWQPLGQRAASAAVMVSLHVISTSAAASRWMDRVKQDGPRLDGWTFIGYELGDGAYMAIYLDGRRYSIDVRKGRFLAKVNAETRSDAQRFAEHVVAAIPNEK